MINKEQVNYTLTLCIRPNNESDKKQLMMEEEVEKKKVQVSPQQELSSIANNLDDFLAMYEGEDEDEDEEDQEIKRTDTVSIVPEFNCCSCHSGVIDSEENIPVLLCHVCENAALGRFV